MYYCLVKNPLLMKKILVTGGSGFIGSHLIDHLLQMENVQVTNLDNMDDFYDRRIKEANILPHLQAKNYEFWEADVFDYKLLMELIDDSFDAIIHLAAKAGVRPSIRQPQHAQKVNVEGTLNLLEIARERGISKFVYASSSSVYGINKRVPWREEDTACQPISPYAATKLAAEHLGHVYHHLYNIQFIALRFFTVYGPRQRPDLAIHRFVDRIHRGLPIHVYGDGSSMRDYTYVGDVVQGILGALQLQQPGHHIFNLGNNQTVSLKALIAAIEEVVGKQALLVHLPPQAGDVPLTCASIEKAQQYLKYQPATELKQGLQHFYQWYLEWKHHRETMPDEKPLSKMG